MQKGKFYQRLGNVSVSKCASYLKENEGMWNLITKRQEKFGVHKSTKTIYLREGDLRSSSLDYSDHPALEVFSYLLTDICKALEIKLPDIKNAIFTLLPAGYSIPPHKDGGVFLTKLNRVHVPIITNDDVMFEIEGEEKNMKEGEIWGIANLDEHSVMNAGRSDRVHLIFDYKEKISD